MSASVSFADCNNKNEVDDLLLSLASYAHSDPDFSELAYETAYYALIDAMGCGFLALNYSECSKLLGPIVTGTTVQNGSRVPGTNYELDPVKAAFDIGTIVRWLDYNDTWLAAEWGHPSDNLGAILAVMDLQNRRGLSSFSLKEVLAAMIKAYEIQGVLALNHSFNRVGLDHVLLVKIASTAMASVLLGASYEETVSALSQAFVDGQSLRTYRHAPNVGSRKSWAAGDATSRGVRLAMMTLQGEKGYPTALSAKTWGFSDVLFKGKPLALARRLSDYVMENILFKIAYPAEFHAQTAVECAFALHERVRSRLDEIERVELTTHESAIRIISKTGPLHNPADRDHCLQYMVAMGLLYGELTADHYEDKIALDPRVDALRDKMQVKEDKQFSLDYLDPDKRSIANSVQVFFKDGGHTDKVTVEYPLGHRRRRKEGIPLLWEKWVKNVRHYYSEEQANVIISSTRDRASLEKMPVNVWVDSLVVSAYATI